MIEEHAKINAQPREPGDPDNMEYVIAAQILYSDETRLANFGGASLWPGYMFFGNQTKYERGKPSCFSAHHFAYFPKASRIFLFYAIYTSIKKYYQLPDNFQDWYKGAFGAATSLNTLRYCKTALMQAVWLFLLDHGYMVAYEHGMVIRCGDGIVRRVPPNLHLFCRLPRKVSFFFKKKIVLLTLWFHFISFPRCLVACVRQLTVCPCPQCHCKKSDIHRLGMKKDIKGRTTNIRIDGHAIQYLIKAA